MTAAAKSKERFLLLPQNLSQNCINRQWLDCANLWHRRGGQSIVASMHGTLLVDYERSGVKHFALHQGDGFFSRLQRKRKIASVVRAHAPRRVWLQNFADLAAMDHLKENIAVRYFPVAPPPANPQTIAQLQKFLSNGGKVVTDGEFATLAMQSEFGLGAEHIHMLPPALDSALYDPARVTPERALALAESWRVPENAALILHLGPLMKDGGQWLLLDILARMKRRDVYAVMLGAEAEQGYRGHLMAEVENRKLLGQVLLIDDCRDLPAALWFANVVMAIGAPARSAMPEILAAQAMGRPLIVSDGGAHMEMVAPGETAWIAPQGDGNAIKTMLAEVLGLSLQDRLRLAMRMRHWVEDNFSYGAWLEAILAA
ncbi:MAG: glycosyltransferase [Alphaproteobacteria bacterium]